MSVTTFYNPELVGQLAACGITSRRSSTPSAPARGFVVEGRRTAPRTREVDRLRGEVTRLAGTSVPQPRGQDLDDATTRFALLELDL